MVKIVSLLIVMSAVAMAGCGINPDDKFLKMETSLKAQETVLTSLENEVASIADRLTAIEERYSSLASAGGRSNVSTAGGLSAAEIQSALKKAGFYTGPVDGKIGPKTQAALKEFQKANGLNPDGVVGEKTKALLLKQSSEETSSY